MEAGPARFKGRAAAAYNRPMSLHRIHGGLVLAVPPRASASGAIRPCPLPPRLYLPLIDERGMPLQCRTAVGQRVRRGEALALGDDELATALPAPASGRIVAIEPRPATRIDGGTAPHLVLESDAGDDAASLPPLAEWRDLDAAVLRRRLAEAGLVGLGGAGFATAQKLARRAATLIVNGAECEPYITCDEALLRERAAEVVAGAEILARIAGAGEIVLALEDRMHEAAAAVRTVLGERIRLELVPTVYPQGGERQLIELLCAREVPSGGWPADIGIVVHNVATAAAAWRAVVHGEALTTRLVSLGGRGVSEPGVFEVRLGTPVEALVAAGGGYTPQAARLIVGGPLMGVALPDDQAALTRTSNAVLVLGTEDLRAPGPELPCIRCGDCADACPVRLQPQELLRLLRNGDDAGAAALGLADCIECGCCAVACPSQIPLVDGYRAAKSRLAATAAQRARADLARTRFVARGQRLAREQAEKVARVAARREAVAQEQAAAATPAIGDETAPAATAAPAPRMDKSAVLAAIARGKARRAQNTTPPPREDEA